MSRFEFMTIQPESVNAQLYALGLSSKTDVHGFDSKLLCLSSDMLTLSLQNLQMHPLKQTVF